MTKFIEVPKARTLINIAYITEVAETVNSKDGSKTYCTISLSKDYNGIDDRRSMVLEPSCYDDLRVQLL